MLILQLSEGSNTPVPEAKSTLPFAYLLDEEEEEEEEGVATLRMMGAKEPTVQENLMAKMEDIFGGLIQRDNKQI